MCNSSFLFILFYYLLPAAPQVILHKELSVRKSPTALKPLLTLMGHFPPVPPSADGAARA